MKAKDKAKEVKAENLSYRVKLLSNFREPYSYCDDCSNIVSRKSVDEYVVYDENTFYDVLDGYIDSPKKKLTSADIHKDFDSPGRIVPDSKVEAIKTYYNGRYEMSKKIHSFLKKADFSKITAEQPLTLKYNIPFEMNFFTVEDDDSYDKHVSMDDAYIEIEISRKQ